MEGKAAKYPETFFGDAWYRDNPKQGPAKRIQDLRYFEGLLTRFMQCCLQLKWKRDNVKKCDSPRVNYGSGRRRDRPVCPLIVIEDGSVAEPRKTTLKVLDILSTSRSKHIELYSAKKSCL
jgi:hypothetical protein